MRKEGRDMLGDLVDTPVSHTFSSSVVFLKNKARFVKLAKRGCAYRCLLRHGGGMIVVIVVVVVVVCLFVGGGIAVRCGMLQVFCGITW